MSILSEAPTQTHPQAAYQPQPPDNCRCHRCGSTTADSYVPEVDLMGEPTGGYWTCDRCVDALVSDDICRCGHCGANTFWADCPCEIALTEAFHARYGLLPVTGGAV